MQSNPKKQYPPKTFESFGGYFVGPNLMAGYRKLLAGLPDFGPLAFVEIHGLSGLHVKGGIELGEVAQWPQYPEASQRVDIFLGAAQNLFVADILCPYMGIGQEETLFGGEAANLIGSSVGGLKSLIGDI